MFFNQQNTTTGNQFFGGRCGGKWGSGHRDWRAHWAHKMQRMTQRVPANVEENDQAFIISLAAPGIIKENIRLDVKDDVLTIAYNGAEPSAEDTQAGAGFTHREFGNTSFERSFMLNNKVSTEAISAAYANGILKVTLPKNPETNKPAQSILVA